MPFNGLTNRSDAAPLIPEDVIREIVQSAPEQSAVLRLGRRLPNMTRAQQRMPVLSALPTAYFVNGDTGLKQTTEMAWANKYLTAEEIAVIVPIPEAVLDDADYDIWGEIRPRIEEAIGNVIDQAILFGVNKPSSWPTDIVTGATAASNVVDHSSFAGDYYDEILGEGGTMSMVEADGFMVTGHIGAVSMKAALRGLRDTTGQPIFIRSLQDKTRYELDGEPMEFINNGSWLANNALLISGDFSQLVYSIRQDMTFKIATEATIQDNAGNPVYNLFQQDMVALRCVFRMAWQLPNPINRLNSDSSTRYPFGVLVP